MTFSEHFLGKSIESIGFVSDIEPFIRKEEPESQTLEYKSAGSPLSEHGDVISAFLNSGGGLLIVGSPREVDVALDGGRKARVCRGPFTPLREISKDDAHRSLLSKVSPIPSSVLVNPVRCDGGCVIVVEVCSSSYPPHQHDWTYWIRLDGETRKAPHALVESLFLQRRGPNMECECVIKRLGTMSSPQPFVDYWELELQLRLTNNSRNIAEYVAIDLKTHLSMDPRRHALHSTDPHPGDTFLPVFQDASSRKVLRYRLRSDVLHAYEQKTFEGRFHIQLDADASRRIPLSLELQAKDMLRTQYEYEVDLGVLGKDIGLTPISMNTIGSI